MKKRYILRSSGLPKESELVGVSAGVSTANQPSSTVLLNQLHIDSIRQNRQGHHVVMAKPEHIAHLKSQHPHVDIEEDYPLQLSRMPGLPNIIHSSQIDSDLILPITVADIYQQPIADCTVYAVASDVGYQGETDAKGRVNIHLANPNIERVVISPRANFWSATLHQIDTSNFSQLNTKLFNLPHVPVMQHWRKMLGIDQYDLQGRGIRVAVIDSGVAPRENLLQAAGGINTLDDADVSTWGIDEKGHGTHCAGIIAAKLDGQPLGVAPAVELYAVKVFPGGFVSDLIEAIAWCIENNIDLINMSLGNPNPSPALSEMIHKAYQAGVTIVAAAGNQAQAVAYPAAYPEVIAVGALGQFATFPTQSAHAAVVGDYLDGYAKWFHAKFSNYGNEVLVAAPGVAIASTVPQGFAAWDGTSMACPYIVGLCALLMEECPWIKRNDASQTDMIRYLLAVSAINLGMPNMLQGYGLSTLPRLLWAAYHMQ